MTDLVGRLFGKSRENSESEDSDNEGDYSEPIGESSESTPQVTMATTLLDIAAQHKVRSAAFSRQMTDLEKLVKASPPDLTKIRGALERQMKAYTQYEDLMDKALDYMDEKSKAGEQDLEKDQHIGQFITKQNALRERHDDLVEQANKALGRQVKKEPPDPSDLGGIGNVQGLAKILTSPKADFPQFSGEDGNTWTFEEWRQRVKEEILDPDIFTETQKLFFLYKSLKGKALQCLTGIPRTPNHLNLIMDTLKERFGTRQALHNELLKMADLSADLSQYTFDKQQEHHDKLSGHLRVIKNFEQIKLQDSVLKECPHCGKSNDLPSGADTYLLPILLSKMPEATRRTFTKKSLEMTDEKYKKRSCEQLLKEFQTNITILKEVPFKKSTSTPKSDEQKGNSAQGNRNGGGRGRNRGNNASVALATTSSGNSNSNAGNPNSGGGKAGGANASKPQKKLRCVLCDAENDHKGVDCTVPMPVGQLRSKVLLVKEKEGKLCHNCLAWSHDTKDCRASHKCEKCPDNPNVVSKPELKHCTKLHSLTQ